MLKSILKPSFPKAIVTTTVLCLFVMAKYKAVETKPATPKTHHASKHSPKVEIAPQVASTSKGKEEIVAPAPMVEKAPIKVARMKVIEGRKKTIIRKRTIRVAQKTTEKNSAPQCGLVMAVLIHADHAIKVDELASFGLEEGPQGDFYSSDSFTTLALVDPQFRADTQFARENPITNQEGILVANDLSYLHQSLTEMDSDVELSQPVIAPTKKTEESSEGPTLVMASTQTLSQNHATVVTQPLPGSKSASPGSLGKKKDDKSSTPDAQASGPINDADAPVESAPKPIEEEEEDDDSAFAANSSVPEPTLVVPSPSVEKPEPTLVMTTPARSLDAVQASAVDSQMVVTQGEKVFQAMNTLVGRPNTPANPPEELTPSPLAPAKAETHLARAGRTILPKGAHGSSAASRSSSEEEEVGGIEGKLTFDQALSDWFEENKGHVELYLNRVGSRDPQDTVFLEYQFPERDFSFDSSTLKGKYRLLAGIYKPGVPVALAELHYDRPISAETSKEMVVFHLKKRDFDLAVSQAATRSQSNFVLAGTVFEGGSGDHRDPKPVSAAQVEIMGYPEMGTVLSDSEGNFRIPNVPSRSEFLLRVASKGYYETQVVVPTQSTNGYVSIYLIARDKVDTITKFFTKREQAHGKSIIMGRVFNPSNRLPQSEQEVNLLGRAGHALYFGALPDTSLRQTTDTGLFGFYNVDPAFRSISTSGSAISDLINVRPDSGYYLELGRGGKKTLRGRLFDPYSQAKIQGEIKVVGSSLSFDTDEDGEFEIEGLQVPAGIVTLEVQAEGYPTTWHSIPWNPRDPEKTHLLYMVEEDLFKETRESVAKVPSIRQTGSLLGGAEQGFFSNPKSCVYVTLQDDEGHTVPEASGPYPLSKPDRPQTGSLCLSQGKPGFSYFNLLPGEYLLKWTNSAGLSLRSHVLHVGADRASIVVN